jgi:hypothetical protein
LIIIEPVSVKRHSFGKTILNLASNGRGGSMSSSLHKEMIKDGIGAVYGDKGSITQNRKNFSYIFTVITTLQLEF